MTRWFEDVKNDPSNIVSSRVRLSRNWEEYKFPSRLEDNEARYMVGRMMQELRDIQGKDGRRDDYLNAKFPYAFSSKYGYLTAYPTNVGTGMKASVVVHLPSLSTSKRFQELLGDMSRFGTTVRGVYGRGTENYGDLYEIYNQKTLGMNEQEIIELVSSVAVQLSQQEREIREASLSKHRLLREDEVYKSYGVLKYARKLSMKEAMTFLSHLRAGIADGLVETKEFAGIYNLMIGIQPANLQKYSRQPLGKDELEVARGRYLREHLPELK